MPKVTRNDGQANSGQMSNMVVGIVDDNVDPDELGRIRVKFPTLHQEPMSFWIRQSSPMAGKERGFYSIPEKEDEVLVMFMQGSQEVGVCMGSFWNGADKPPTEAKDGLPGPDKTKIDGGQWSKDTFEQGSQDLSKNDRRFWRSRSGSMMVFDDSEGAESIQMWDKNHELAFVFDSTNGRIVLSNSKGDIHIRSKNDIFIEAGNDIKWIAKNNIEGESGKDTIHTAKMNYKLTAEMNLDTKSKMNTTMKADMNFTSEAKMNMKTEGKMNFEAKGGVSAKLQGGATAIVKGAMVMIN